MNPIIQIFVGLSSYTFILSTLMGAGLGLTIKEIIDPLKKVRVTLSVLLINFLLIPCLAYSMATLFKLDASLAAGLIIISCCAGAPFLPRLVIQAKGNIAHTVGVMVLLIVATVIFAPTVLPLLIPGMAIHPMKVAIMLFLTMLLPLLTGLWIKSSKPGLASKLQRCMNIAALVSIAFAMAFGLSADYKLLVSAYGTGLYYIAGLFTILTVLIGFIFSGRSRPDKIVMTFSAGARNVPAALLIAVSSFADTRIVTVVLVCCLLEFILLYLLSHICGKGAS
jgi:BASS family bile acid:Na+ symporter